MSVSENLEALSIVVVGGGTGSFTLLQELKNVTPDITAIVNMSDDGGSTGRLRDEYGVLPSGDARQCLVALSDEPEVRDLFNYRFGEGNGRGAFAGHSLGNVLLAGLEMQHGSFEEAIRIASKILRTRGAVVPVTLGNHTLVMDDGGHEVRGESAIGDHKITHDDAMVRLVPEAELNPEAQSAILDADIVVIAPGNFFCSILPVLAVNGVADALQQTDATKVAVTNLMTKPNHTDGWHVADYDKRLEQYAGKGVIDYVVYNDQAPPEELIRKYAAEGEQPVAYSPERFAEIAAQAVGVSLVAKGIVSQDPNDRAIRRTLIRHDAATVASIIEALHTQL